MHDLLVFLVLLVLLEHLMADAGRDGAWTRRAAWLSVSCRPAGRRVPDVRWISDGSWHIAQSDREMVITQALLDDLSARAKASPRLRMNYDLRNSPEDGSQRMLNAIEPGSVVPVHRHRTSSETVVCLRGRMVEEYYSEAGELVDAVELIPGGPVVALNIPAGQWHTVRSLESGSVLLEMKDGKYEALGGEDVLRL